ncbi:MAG: CpXC domain-containing protein [Oscillospiraceae bacterium]|nr:CpXC domain-containing protein [Oscillospiraceae bacterium]
MSTQVNKDVCCPQCGKPVRTKMWTGISADTEPVLRQKVLDETLFDWQCPHCGYQAELVYPCLYHDKEKKFMIYLVPEGSGKDLKAVEVDKRFPQLDGITKREVSSPMELKEKILIFEAGLNDVGVELVKAGLAGIVEERQGKAVETGCFCFASQETDRMGFLFFLEGEENPVKKATRFATYEKAMEISEECGGVQGNDFVRVDDSLAARVLENFQRT